MGKLYLSPMKMGTKRDPAWQADDTYDPDHDGEKNEDADAKPHLRHGGRRCQIHPVVTEAVCRMVAEGKTLKEICESSRAMPHPVTVRRWAKEYPLFAKELAMARQLRGKQPYKTGPRKSSFDNAIATYIFDQMKQGRTLSDVLREPDMPTHTTLMRWRRLKPKFNDSLNALMRRRDDPSFEPVVPVRRQQGTVGRPAEYDAARMAEIKADILAKIEGVGFVAPILKASGMPSNATVSKWRDADPAFNDAIRQAQNKYRLASYSKATPKPDKDSGRKATLLIKISDGHGIARAGEGLGIRKEEYERWMKSDPVFAASVWEIKQAQLDKES